MKIEKFYNYFIFLYPLIDFLLKPQKKVLLKKINDLPIGNLLEIGIGTGSHIPDYKNHSVIGIDISDKSIEVAKKRNANTKVNLFIMDGKSLSFDHESFDYIVISHVIAVTPNAEKMIAECFRVLKKEGLLIILNHETPNNWVRYIDQVFNYVSKFFKFSSHFKIGQIETLRLFKIIEEYEIGILAYFKIVVFMKL